MTSHTTKEFADLRVDVVPTVMVRPILTPPRSFNDPPDPPLYCYLNPYTKGIELVTELLTIFPHAVRTKDGPLVLSLGSAIFVGKHLWTNYPDGLPARLRVVLARTYEQDKAIGLTSRWIDVTGVPSSWQLREPLKKPQLFVSKPALPVT